MSSAFPNEVMCMYPYMLYDNNKIYTMNGYLDGFPISFETLEEGKKWMFTKQEELNGYNRLC